MKQYSNVYKLGGYEFIYDYENNIVIWVERMTKQMEEENKEFIKKYGSPIYEEIRKGLTEIDSIGLSLNNWTNIDARAGYLSEWIKRIKENIRYEKQMENF